MGKGAVSTVGRENGVHLHGQAAVRIVPVVGHFRLWDFGGAVVVVFMPGTQDQIAAVFAAGVRQPADGVFTQVQIVADDPLILLIGDQVKIGV